MEGLEFTRFDSEPYYFPMERTEINFMIFIFCFFILINFIKTKKENSKYVVIIFAMFLFIIARLMMLYQFYSHITNNINEAGFILYCSSLWILLMLFLEIKPSLIMIMTFIIYYMSGCYLSTVYLGFPLDMLIYLLSIIILLISIFTKWINIKVGMIMMFLMPLILPIGKIIAIIIQYYCNFSGEIKIDISIKQYYIMLMLFVFLTLINFIKGRKEKINDIVSVFGIFLYLIGFLTNIVDGMRNGIYHTNNIELVLYASSILILLINCFNLKKHIKIFSMVIIYSLVATYISQIDLSYFALSILLYIMSILTLIVFMVKLAVNMRDKNKII